MNHALGPRGFVCNLIYFCRVEVHTDLPIKKSIGCAFGDQQSEKDCLIYRKEIFFGFANDHIASCRACANSAWLVSAFFKRVPRDEPHPCGVAPGARSTQACKQARRSKYCPGRYSCKRSRNQRDKSNVQLGCCAGLTERRHALRTAREARRSIDQQAPG